MEEAFIRVIIVVAWERGEGGRLGKDTDYLQEGPRRGSGAGHDK